MRSEMRERIERKQQRRKGGPLDSRLDDRRRPQRERRGTVPQEAPLTRQQKLFGERRQNPRER
jgi:hypothetical protein